MADESNHDQLISEFCDLTGASPADAQQFLAANRWDLSGAAAEFYTSQEEGISTAQEGVEDDPQETEAYTGPRTLDGRPAPQSIPSVGSSSRVAAPPRRGVAGIQTLGSMASGPSRRGAHGHDDDDDSDDSDYGQEGEPRDLFAGGEKSGLAVQDPNQKRNEQPRKVVEDILKKARANAPRAEEPAAAPSRFRGSGQTLGGDDTPSQVIPDPNAATSQQGPIQTRVLHLWEDGFSIDDGELRRFDDQQNAADLYMIRQGRAPLHLMGVRNDQPVDVQLYKHEEKYKAPPKVYKPFSGGGHRLGSPTPGGPSTTTAPTSSAPAASSVPSASSTPAAPEVEIDSTQPTINLRIQMTDGSRLPARFNVTHTIGDVYGFIERALPGSNGRPWVLATTFPNKEHTDKSLVLGEVAEFKRGGTAVQKWKD